MEGEINSTQVERMKISTYGSFLAESLADWSKQVVSLVEQKKFYGSVIQRELALISNLFTVDNFPNITRRDGKLLNFTKLLAWFEPMLTNEYCTVFNITCNMTGCGINDKCKLEEWCVNVGEEILDGKDLDLSPVQKEFICTLRNASIVLKNGNLYTGSMSKVELPHGWGAEFAGTDNASVIYEGNWVHGKKDGLGSLYTPKSKTPYYSGSMLNDAMWGQGVLYYASGNKMFTGLMANGFIQKGKLFKDTPQSQAISSVDETNIPVVRLNFQDTEISPFLPPAATSETRD
ncbi:uncharacterized protein LOC111706208 [Eurytemora carolleeae]|uniref:uncharacterized protein LOC111706208 n=1 Tax=Eurytemora carolleeae TaxID=1294199 RepID=UPI000C78D7D4|nr:uncharacterized protein LOC111706208 [Eurytemora carolleeae]|eukprot:XP_023334777.1 uncharacterized protein LOC111706208 [Eurytemora affinis]